MKGKGSISQAPHSRLRWILGVQLVWLALVGLLGAWWAKFALTQAERITELERLQNVAAEGDSQWIRTQRMLFWESSTFFLLMLLSTGVLLYWYFRDERRARGLQAFFASVTHELKTPLTSIRLQAESIAESQDNPKHREEEMAGLIQRLLEDVSRLESQVERTLELARMEGGGPVFTQAVRIKPWIERTLSGWGETHADRVDIRSEIEDVTLLADTSAIQVILRNLLENSLRHSSKDRVSVVLSSRRASKGDGVVLVYRDDGRGFSGDVATLGKLFQKGPNSQGAGVGLYLVKLLMERMGGKAEFHTPAAGFQISLSFPGAKADGT